MIRLVTLEILEYVEGSKLHERHEIIDIDYRLYIVDIDLESYFKENFLE